LLKELIQPHRYANSTRRANTTPRHVAGTTLLTVKDSPPYVTG
jgi:hypothetical protein